MTDNLGYGNIDCFGNENTKTPKLDKMADECNRFLTYHSNGAVCSSSRVAFLTENYQQRTGNTCVVTEKSQRNAGLPLSEITEDIYKFPLYNLKENQSKKNVANINTAKVDEFKKLLANYIKKCKSTQRNPQKIKKWMTCQKLIG